MGSFVADCVAGTARVEEVTAYIDRWKQDKSDEPLHCYLGLTQEQYDSWQGNPALLPWIVASYEPTPYEKYGIECAEGWARLYNPIIEQCNAQGVEIFSIKEKFGGLRISTKPLKPPEQVHRAIRIAQHQSLKVCEVCGQFGTLRDYEDRRLKTLCDRHQHQYAIGDLQIQPVGLR